MGAWRTPLLVTGTLLALAMSGPAAADLDDPRVRVGPRSVCVDSKEVSVHIGRCGRAPAANRPATTVRIFTDVPRSARTSRPVRPPRRVRAEAPAPVRQAPVAKPKPKPTPKPVITHARLRAVQVEPPRRRPSPLGSVLLMVVLTTVIAATTAVAFSVR